MLNSVYLPATQRLLQNPAAPVGLYSTADLESYINTARGQLSGEGECVRRYPTLTLTAGQQIYPFSSIDLTTDPNGPQGAQGVLHVRTIWIKVGAGQVWIRPRPFSWLSLYELNNPVPVQAQPKVWSQFGQGSAPQPGTTEAGGGSFFVSPVPDTTYTAVLDCVCYPQPLVDDSTVEAIPYLWTDAVPYFAAYMAFLSSQVPARQGDGDRMKERYTEFVNRARRFATPDVLSSIYEQQPNPVRANQLGVQAAR